MNVFGFERGEAIAAIFATFLFSVFLGFLLGLMRYMMIGSLERKD
jgi:hypothetical protein